MALAFDQVLTAWDQAGVFEYLLPFLIIFAISFGLLEKVGLFTSKSKVNNQDVVAPNRKLNAILALSMGLLFLQNAYLRMLFQRFVPNVSFVFVVILMLLLMIGLFASPFQAWTGWALFLGVAFSIISIIIAAANDYLGQGYSSLYEWWFTMDTTAKSTLVLVAIIVVVLIVVLREPGGTGWIEGFSRGIRGEEMTGRGRGGTPPTGG